MWRITIILIIFSILSSNSDAQDLFVKKDIQGLNGISHNNGVAVADYDKDGHLDIYVVATERYIESAETTWSRLYKNNNDATFTDVTSASGLQGSYDHNLTLPNLPFFLTGELRHGASWGDYDNDGYPDLFLTNYVYNKLYHNNGDGSFEDVTTASGLDDQAECYSTSSMWFDYNNDGLLDLLISAWAFCADSRMFENNGDGTFTDVSEKIAFSGDGNTWMTLPVDVNEDGWTDLFFVNDFRSNTLLINNQGTFTDETIPYGFLTTDLRNHMGSTYADVDHDGLLDIYISDIDRNSLWMNEDGHFTNRAVELGVDKTKWSWQTRFGDMDLDGDQDILTINGYDSFHENYLQYKWES